MEQPAAAPPIVPMPPPQLKPKVKTVDRSVNTDQARVRNTDSSTELTMLQIFTDKEVEAKMEKHGEKLKRDDEVARAKLRVRFLLCHLDLF
jgi:hypothetical protein